MTKTKTRKRLVFCDLKIKKLTAINQDYAVIINISYHTYNFYEVLFV